MRPQIIPLLSALSISLLILSLLLPRLFQNSEGFAGATSAAMLFLILFVIGTLIGGYLLVYAVRGFGTLSTMMRIVAVLPTGVFILTAVYILSRLA